MERVTIWGGGGGVGEFPKVKQQTKFLTLRSTKGLSPRTGKNKS